MKEFQRKYRPTELSQVVGQDAAVNTIQQFVKRKAIPHAVLFEGPPGTGKTTLARIVAGLAGATGSDISEINAAESRGIDDMRAIQSRCGQAAFNKNSTCRVWILDEAHQLSKRQGGDAQTSILKTLEEPPPTAYFFLCSSEPQHLLKAILSRCTRIVTKPISQEALKSLVQKVCTLEKLKVSAAVVAKITDIAAGSGRDALKLLDAIAGLQDEESRLDFLSRADTEVESIKLCRALCNKSVSWPEVAGIIKGIEDDPEKIRRMILGYFTAICLGGGGPLLSLAAYVLEVFRDHYFDCGKAGLVANCYEVVQTHKAKGKK